LHGRLRTAECKALEGGPGHRNAKAASALDHFGRTGLGDECMAKGYEIKVVPAKDPTVAKDLHLPNRKPK
jgi:hypothetical protein